MWINQTNRTTIQKIFLQNHAFQQNELSKLSELDVVAVPGADGTGKEPDSEKGGRSEDLCGLDEEILKMWSASEGS